MIQPNSILPSIDADADRRSALAKVYSLLLRLAEEAENNSLVSENPTIEETDSTGKDSFKEEI